MLVDSCEAVVIVLSSPPASVCKCSRSLSLALGLDFFWRNGNAGSCVALVQHDSCRAHSWSYSFLPDGLLRVIHEYLHPFRGWDSEQSI